MLVIAPHPDDEVIGAFGLMTRLQRRGSIVRVLVMTDGAASHPGSSRWPRRRLVAERQRETRRALRTLGVGAGAIRFLGLPDGALASQSAAGRRALRAALSGLPKPLLVVGPYAGDDHADHRATAEVVASSRQPGARLLAYPVWPARRRSDAGQILPLTTQERLAKRRAIGSYRTQTGRITDDPAGFALTRAQIAAFSRPSEVFMGPRL